MMALTQSVWSVAIMASKTTDKPQGESFGARLARVRKERGFTQTELAEALGVTQRVVSYYECETQHPPAALLPKIAKTLNVSADVLLGLDIVPEDGRTADARLRRRLRDLEKLPPADRKAVIQVIDAMLERRR